MPLSACALEEDTWRARNQATGRSEAEIVAEVRERFESLPPDEFPLLSKHSDAMTSGGGETRLQFGLDLLIGGLSALD